MTTNTIHHTPIETGSGTTTADSVDTLVQTVAQGISDPSKFTPVHNAKEVADISARAQAQGYYSPAFEDSLALSLKESIAHGWYTRTAVKTPPPANIMQAVRNRT